MMLFGWLVFLHKTDIYCATWLSVTPNTVQGFHKRDWRDWSKHPHFFILIFKSQALVKKTEFKNMHTKKQRAVTKQYVFFLFYKYTVSNRPRFWMNIFARSLKIDDVGCKRPALDQVLSLSVQISIFSSTVYPAARLISDSIQSNREKEIM